MEQAQGRRAAKGLTKSARSHAHPGAGAHESKIHREARGGCAALPVAHQALARNDSGRAWAAAWGGPSVSSGANVSFGARGDARGLLSRCAKAVAERPLQIGPYPRITSGEKEKAAKTKPIIFVLFRPPARPRW